MSKTLYPPTVTPVFAVENPTPYQAQAIFDWALANGTQISYKPHEYSGRKYFGIDRLYKTRRSDFKVNFVGNILTFEEFAELTGVEFSS